MDNNTRKALEASIKHWQENTQASAPHEASVYSDACALCRMFYSDKNMCKGCPVALKVGHIECEHTPWKRCHSSFMAWDANYQQTGSNIGRARFRKAALDMMKFLESLRPTEE